MLARRFEEQVKKTPGNIAVKEGEKVYTYSQLNAYANRIARLIPGTRCGDTVGLLLDHGVHMIAAVLGVLKAGKIYVPLSVDYPENRLSYMLSDSESSLILTTDTHRSFALKLARTLGIPWLDIHAAEIGEDSGEENPHREKAGEKIAYILYTSGSTGRPKGVVQTHQNADYYNRNWVRVFSITGADRMTLFSSFCHDGSVQDMYSALYTGAALYPLNMKNRENTVELSEFLKEENITIWHSVPSLYSYFVNSLEGEEVFPGIRFILLGGEPVRQHEVEMFKKYFPHAALANVYGQTESSVNSICIIKRDQVYKKPWIGTPLERTKIFVVDPRGRPVDPLESGEILVACPHIAPGYHKNPEATRNAFSQHRELGRLYWTGDLGRLAINGSIEYLGRKDHQVKIRGFRVEPGEIETQLLKHPGIKEAIVTTGESENRDKYLCAYTVPAKTGDNRVNSSVLRDFLAKELPGYMIPTYFVPLEKMPLTPGGKIDRKALPEPFIETAAGYAAPQNPLQIELVGMWSEILWGGDTGAAKSLQVKIGIDDNFFELGGHSLKATIMASRLFRQLKVKIPLAEIFKNPTIRSLSRYIEQVDKQAYTAISKAETKEYYMLSSAQQRLYVLHQMEPGLTVYNIPLVVVLEGEPDKIKLRDVFARLVRRHESLRTSFHLLHDEPVQKVHDEVEFEIKYYCAERKAQSAERKEERHAPCAVRFASTLKNFIRPFDLSQAPLLRVGMVQTAPKQHLLMADMHHIITDGTSNAILIQEFTALYDGKELPGLRTRYKDYALWQRHLLQTTAMKRQETYWLKCFSPPAPPLNLPTDYPRPSIQSFAGKSIDFQMGIDITRRLNRMAVKAGATLYMVLLAITNVFLSKLTGQEDIVVGTPVAGRRHAELENIVGMFVNTLPLRNQPSIEKTFLKFLAEIREKTTTAFDRQDYPFEELVEKVMIDRDASRNPLFDVIMVLQNYDPKTGNIPQTTIKELKVKPYAGEELTVKTDITLTGWEKEENLCFKLAYCTKLFKPGTIQRYAGYFKQVAVTVLDNPGITLNQVEIITAVEKVRILEVFNNTGFQYPTGRTLHELFEQQAAGTPHHIAVIGAGTGKPGKQDLHITYKQLSRRSNQLARLLREKGVEPDAIVGLMLERSIEMVLGLLGILKAGGAYLPIDPDYPKERINYMLEDSKVNILMKSDKSFSNSQIMEGIEIVFPGFPAAHLSTAPVTISSPASVTSLAYVIYTSGSTGKPKGVMISHEGIANRLHWMQEAFGLTLDDRVLQKTPFSFDVSVWEFFWPLLNGAILVMAVPGGHKDCAYLVGTIIKQKITTIHFVPSMLHVFLEEPGPGKIFSLKRVICSGEALPVKYQQRFFQCFKGRTELHNLYGPTEASVDVSHWPCKANDTHRSVPIGKPIANTRIYILDRHLKPVPIGVHGEIHIGGIQLARGYLNQPELTVEKFLSPVNRSYKSYWSYNSKKIYKTGDLAQWLPDGNIEFLGRIDSQVKLRGFRIELGEIESILTGHPAIKEAIVTVNRGNDGEGKYLCAYYITAGHETQKGDTNELREHLAKRIPGYMIPSYFVRLEKIPLTPNGKVDWKALPEPGLKTGDDYVPPRDTIEQTLAGLWVEVLGRGARHDSQSQVSIGIDDNFFELGGHSLKAAVLISRVQKVLEVKIPLAEIFKTSTIRGLSAYIKQAKKKKYTGVKPVEKKDYYVVSMMQKRLYILSRLEEVKTAYNLSAAMIVEGQLSHDLLERAFQRLIQRHETLRTSFHMICDEPVQKVHDQVEFEIEYYDLYRTRVEVKVEDSEGTGGLAPLPIEPASSSQQPAADIISSFIRPFDLSRAPLQRVELVHLEQEKYLLVFDMHHIISDGTSMGIFVRDILEFYGDRELLPLKVQYKDFSHWQTSPGTRAAIENQEAYWLERFAGELPQLNIYTDYPRPAVQSFAGKKISFMFDRESVQKIQELLKETNTTLYMFLLAVYTILLSRYSQQEDIVVGTPAAGRQHRDFQDIIGLFINVLPMRNFPGSHKTFRQFLTEVKENTLEAYENQEYPFDELMEALDISKDVSRNPLFEAELVLQNMEQTELKAPGLQFTDYIYESWSIQVDLALYAEETSKGINFGLKYSTALFKQETMEHFTRVFREITNTVVENKETRLGDIEVSHQLGVITTDAYKNSQSRFDF